MDQIKRAVVEVIQTMLVSDDMMNRIKRDAAAIDVESQPLTDLQTTIRVKQTTDRPARYFTVRVTENL